MIDLFLKRLFDMAFSFMGLVAGFPIFLMISLWIKLDSPGPVFYRGVRVGRGSNPFRIYKFRSMVVNADQIGASSTGDDDPRLTKSGKFLRKYKLDEFPQLINVLRGDMSFVGPRPQVTWAVEGYSEEQKHLLTIRPGITDPASVMFQNEGEILRGSSDPDKAYMEKIHPEKMRICLEFVRTRSFLGDIKIIIATMMVVIRPKTGSSAE